MQVDDVKLTGERASYQQKTGFLARYADISYFNYDLSGAYAPVSEGIDISVTGIEDLSNNDIGITASVRSGLLFLNHIPASSEVLVYNASGTFLRKENNYSGSDILLPQRGVYFAVIRNGNETKSVKVVY